MSGEGTLNADVAVYNAAAAADSGPPSITSDPLVDGATPIEQLLRALGLAANSGDAFDESAGIDDYTQRDAAMTDAADGFAHQDSAATTDMSQLPQLAAGIAGALAGALTGVLTPVTQLPAQVAQGAGQALAAGTALVSGYRAEDPAISDNQDYPDSSSADPLTGDPGLPGLTDDLSGLSDPASGGTTSPMALLGPAPTPSAATAPASAAPIAVRTASTTPPPTAGLGGMAGMPMIPPGPLSATSTNAAVQPETKRATVPAVRNGAPVQGRLVGLPTPRTVEGRPVEARRIVAPGGDPAGGS